MLRWVTVAGSRFPAAVDLYLQTDATIIEVYAFTTDIKEKHLAEQFPAPLTLLLEYALDRRNSRLILRLLRNRGSAPPADPCCWTRAAAQPPCSL